MNMNNRKNKPLPEEHISIGLEAYNKLKEFLTEKKYQSWHEHNNQLPTFLRKFSLGEILISIVWFCFDTLKKFVQNKYKFSPEILGNLNVLVKNTFCSEKMTNDHLYEILKTLSNQSFYKQSRKSEWSEEMSIILSQMNQYDEAAQMLINVLEKETYEIVRLNISDRAKKFISLKKDIDSDLIGKIKRLILPFEPNIPCITIEAVEAFENTTGNKKVYKSIQGDTTNFFSVEQVALEHYKTQGFENGTHSEQAQIVTIFGLLFWDIIYNYHVPNTFITRLQTQPLDMKSSAFFKNRQAKIEERLQNIENWSEEELFEKINFAKRVENVCSILNPLYCENPDVLKDFVKSIDRHVLSKIMERLAKNFGMTRAGFPDLIVWSSVTKKCKFVEVKSRNDVLSNKQILWLHYLNSIGADAEVCSVHSVGAKRKSVAKTFHVDQN